MNILFTCAGRRTYLLKYFKDNVDRGDKIIATDMQLSAPALQMADVKLQVPSVYDSKYINILVSICKQYNANALISLNDLELPILSANKALFQEIGVQVIVSSQNVIDICFAMTDLYVYHTTPLAIEDETLFLPLPSEQKLTIHVPITSSVARPSPATAP